MFTPAAVELLAGNTNTLEEVEQEESDEMRLYREYYYLMTSSGLLVTSLMEKK